MVVRVIAICVIGTMMAAAGMSRIVIAMSLVVVAGRLGRRREIRSDGRTNLDSEPSFRKRIDIRHVAGRHHRSCQKQPGQQAYGYGTNEGTTAKSVDGIHAAEASTAFFLPSSSPDK